MRGYRMLVAYDGTDYAGWQIQPGMVTVQGQLEAALERILGVAVRVVASGRTDAGVHALGQVVSFRCDTRLSPAILRCAINALTPDAIHVRELCEVADGFHAIRDAVAKRYRYVIHDGGEARRVLPPVFLADAVPAGCRTDGTCRPAPGRNARFPEFRIGGRAAQDQCPNSLRLGAQPVLLPRHATDRDRSGGGRIPVPHGAQHRRLTGPGWPGGPARELAGRAACGARSAQAGSTAPARGLMLLQVRYADACGEGRGGEGRGGESIRDQPRDQGDVCESPM